MNDRDEVARIGRGALWGVAATLVMTVFMGFGLGWSRGLGGQSAVFPRLIAEQILGRDHGPGLMLLAMFGHLVYGALAGLAFAYFARPMTFLKGVGWGAFLWFVMGITWIPWLGMSSFGLFNGRSGFAFGTLVLHLVFGATLGLLAARDDARHHATFDDLGRLLPRAPAG